VDNRLGKKWKFGSRIICEKRGERRFAMRRLAELTFCRLRVLILRVVVLSVLLPPFDAVSLRPYNFSVNTPIKESGCTTLEFEREERARCAPARLGAVWSARSRSGRRAWRVGSINVPENPKESKIQ
jgi:hypothetical protein